MTILYEDNCLVVLIKPAGLISEGVEGSSVAAFLQSENGIPLVYPVHRLDRETGGIMVYAKTREAAAALSRSFAEGKTEKFYYAVTAAALPEPAGGMTDLLYRDARKNKSYVVNRMRKGVKEARLAYETMAVLPKRYLYRVRLFTGRTHQIRVQFASRKCPLLGDSRYGGDRSYPLSLFCGGLSFPHPVTGAKLSFSAVPPPAHPGFSGFFPPVGN